MENRSSLSHNLGVMLGLLAKYEYNNFLCIIVILDFHCTDLIEYIIEFLISKLKVYWGDVLPWFAFAHFYTIFL